MSKEELKNSIATQIQFHTISGETFEKTVKRIANRSFEFAKQEAIAFAEWKEENNYWSDNDDGEKAFDLLRWSKDSANPEYITTEQLYNLFLESEKQKV